MWEWRKHLFCTALILWFQVIFPYKLPQNPWHSHDLHTCRLQTSQESTYHRMNLLCWNVRCYLPPFLTIGIPDKLMGSTESCLQNQSINVNGNFILSLSDVQSVWNVMIVPSFMKENDFPLHYPKLHSFISLCPWSFMKLDKPEDTNLAKLGRKNLISFPFNAPNSNKIRTHETTW